jgi:hypothetical protein
MTHRTPGSTAPRRPRPSPPRTDGLTEQADLVRETWEKLLRVRPL